jgi:hypothetical protein
LTLKIGCLIWFVLLSSREGLKELRRTAELRRNCLEEGFHVPITDS